MPINDEADITSPKYLGDLQVVTRLLKAFGQDVLTFTGDDITKHADEKSRKLAKVFLGQNKNFPGPAWFSPGQIDVEVATREGIDSKDPEERVAGGLVNMATKLLQIVQKNPADWQGQVDKVLRYYSYLISGLPLYMV